MEKKMAYIYVITNLINGKQYVGKTVNSIKIRWTQHLNSIYKPTTEKRPLYTAMRKYGSKNFKIEQLEECSSLKAGEREQYWISKLDTYKNGYNATIGGDGKQLYNYQDIVNKYLELYNINEVKKVFNCTKETVRRALREYHITPISSTEVVRKKKCKKVAMIDKDSNEVLKIFNSSREATEYLGKSWHKNINVVCRGQRKTAFGYKWKYV